MSLGDFEPDVWIPSSHAAVRPGTISLDELARIDVIHGPRRAEPGTYDAWTRVLRTVDPRFAFTDPPLRHSLPMDLAFAATADRPAAVLTGPSVIAGSHPGLIRLPRLMVAHDMVRVGLEDHPLTATAALVWNGDLPRPLQQILFDTADGITAPELAWASSRRREGQVTGSPGTYRRACPAAPGVRPPLAGASRSDEALDGRRSPRSPPKRGEHDDPTAVRPGERRRLAPSGDGGGIRHLPGQLDPVPGADQTAISPWLTDQRPDRDRLGETI